MGQLVCDLCGKTNFIKEEGVFVCQDCGAKYSVEEARKMTEASKAASKGAKARIDKKAVQKTARKVAAQAAGAEILPPLAKPTDFNPSAIEVSQLSAQGINTYACQAYRMLIDEYEHIEHPTQARQEELLTHAKECFALLEAAAMIDADDHLTNLLIYENCKEIENSLKRSNYWEQTEEGEWKKHSLPLSVSTKLAGQKESWSDKAKVQRQELQQQWLQNHPGDVEQKLELNRKIEELEAKLCELKDEKRSHGLFDFSGKREVKDRMKPVKEELSKLRSQVSAIDKACNTEIDTLLEELSKSFTRLNF